ncbi:MAG: iron-containing redox enzyme family protein [Thiobacillaceae bacterium]
MSFFEDLSVSTTCDRNQMIGIPVIQRALSGDVSHQEYLDYLSQAYHHVKHTVPLLMACGARLPERLNWLREAVATYIEEEIGHEEWILDDIAAAGGDPEAVRNSRPHPATELMVSYAYDTIQRRNPAGFFGMVYVLEGTSVNLAHRAAEAIRNSLGLPQTAFRYLTSHGSVDQDHIAFLETLVNRLVDSADQDEVLHCASMFFRLYGEVFRSVAQ